ncbi:hypothetical protein V6N13_008845 [Hibiscus sabdariffa]
MGDYWFLKGNRQEGKVTLFVDNLPKSLHWQGLWHIFARHGDVVDAYIANKLNKGGRRFGFVRFKKEVDADRAIERLNGLLVYGNKIFVGLAKYSIRTSSGNKVKLGKSSDETQTNMSSKQGLAQLNKDISKSDGKAPIEEIEVVGQKKEMQVGKVLRKIQGHVIDEELWNLKRCLVGVMASVCKTSSISSRLQSWGLGEINVKSMGGKSFFLSFADDELFTMLEDLEWSYLKEIFVDVYPWTENVNQMERATWLEISGMPLHCWNQCTFKRMAKLWGSFEALGENTFRFKNCEKVTVLITTFQVETIDEVIEIEVGNLVFKVRIKEFGFSDDSTALQPGRAKTPIRTDGDKEESISGSSSEADKIQSPELDTGGRGCYGGILSQERKY